MLTVFTLGAQAACLKDGQLLIDGHAPDVKGLESAVEGFRESVKAELPSGLNLIIRMDILNLRTNADIVKQGNELTIQVLGGMLRHRSMTPDALLLLLCHEVGHFLGGPPLKSRTGWSSTEGQSDYYSGEKCARLLGMDESSFINAAVVLTSIYAEVSKEAPPQIEQCDERRVERTNFGYPSAQCRLDTLVAGWTGKERPRCWFRE